MFTNGMSETASTNICLREVNPEAFKAMLEYMYSGQVDMDEIKDNEALLLHLLLLADQFGIPTLLQECYKMLLECLSEVVPKSLMLVHDCSMAVSPHNHSVLLA